MQTQADNRANKAKEDKPKASQGKEDKRRGRGPLNTKEAPKKSDGPSVLKVARPVRKLVAAGTAEEIEIQAELENQEQVTTESTEQEK